MDRICENTQKIAGFLQQHEKVAWVNYAGLEDHPDHALVRRYLSGKASGILTFGLEGPAGQGRERTLGDVGLHTADRGGESAF